MNVYVLTFTESRMHGNVPVRFGERLAETETCKGQGAAIRLHRDNPDLMNNMFIGMAVLLAAGTVSSLIVFA